MRRLLLFLMLGLAAPAFGAKREAEDLKRQIDTQRAAASDLERLDDRKLVTDEITLLRAWLDEATGQLSKEEFDKSREVIERCIAQTELIRQKSAAARMSAQAAEREGLLKRSREKVEHTRQAIQQAAINKKAMEMNVK
jgi:hypothetical protein